MTATGYVCRHDPACGVWGGVPGHSVKCAEENAKRLGKLRAVADILLHYRDGDEVGWDEEFARLRAEHGERLYEIARTAARDGIRNPIVLGADGRIWDGHHRLCVALDFGITHVPVTTSEEAA